MNRPMPSFAMGRSGTTRFLPTPSGPEGSSGRRLIGAILDYPFSFHLFSVDPFLLRCIELARKAGIATAPNPMVGAVVVHDGKIIGEGFHRKFGGAHAEVEAINAVKDKTLLKKATIYVSLEPCSHHGKTPPCCELITSHGIPKVVIGIKDPFAKVDGKGIKHLESHDTVVEIAGNPAPFRELNRHFFLNQEKKRPYITLKWAQSADGFISKHVNGMPARAQISGSQNHRWVHEARASHQAILVGSKTVLTDNPSLTTRAFPGSDPVRIILDRDLEIPPTHPIYKRQSRLIMINDQQEAKMGHVRFIKHDQDSLQPILEKLYQDYEIGSILVEGGANVLQQFLDQELYDELRLTTGAMSLEAGLTAPEVPTDLKWADCLRMAADEVRIWRREV